MLKRILMMASAAMLVAFSIDVSVQAKTSTAGDGIIERAFHLAKAGECESLGDVAKKLKAEGFSNGMIERHFDGLTIRTQLGDLCKKA